MNHELMHGDFVYCTMKKKVQYSWKEPRFLAACLITTKSFFMDTVLPSERGSVGKRWFLIWEFLVSISAPEHSEVLAVFSLVMSNKSRDSNFNLLSDWLLPISFFPYSIKACWIQIVTDPVSYRLDQDASHK